MSEGNNKQAIALSSVGASAAMVVMKLVVGLMTGSLGILSEAAHSGLDLWATTLTWLAVRVSDRPADEQHPYGHGKFESLSALVGTVLLFITSIGVAREAVLHLMGTPEPVEITWYGMGVILVSIAIDVARSRALMRAAKETGSPALHADALHFSTDILSSCVVLVGLVGVYFGVTWADSAAALGVSLFIAHAGWELGQHTLAVLVDAAPEGINERVRNAVLAVPGVAQVSWVRARLGGTTIFVDLAIKVSRTMPLEQVVTLKESVVDAVKATVENGQILIIAEPLALDDETINQTVHLLAAAKGLFLHSVKVAQINDRTHVSLHMEVDAALTLAQAHAQATDMEQALCKELGDDIVADIHIDPRRAHVFFGTSVTGPIYDTIHAAVAKAVADYPLVKGFHHLLVQTREDGLYMSCHCLFSEECSIMDVHEVTERLEYALMRSVEGLTTVVVHAEPVSHPEPLSHDKPHSPHKNGPTAA